jgi:serine/threonine protein kinase
MSLAAGDKLGPYEIISLIGKGGMGEVYSAHDPRTGRAVAALNHPNIWCRKNSLSVRSSTDMAIVF